MIDNFASAIIKCHKRRLKMADAFQTLRCPACGEVMKKIFIPDAGINIDICSEGCGGIYFDSKELQNFQKGNDSGVNEINKYLDGKTFAPTDTTRIRMCPNCSAKMVKTRIHGLNVEIDTCYSCGGVFLDNGELEFIRAGVRHKPVAQVRHEYQNTDVLREFYKEAQLEEQKFNFVYDVLFRPRTYRRGGFDIFDLFYYMFR